MANNVGSIDRILRLVLGIVVAAAPFVVEFPANFAHIARIGLPIVGAILVLTALIRFCPLYRLLGLSTRRI